MSIKQSLDNENIPYSVVGRFVTRPNPSRPTGWDVGILMPFRSYVGKALQPNFIYEIIDFEGSIIFQPVGPCCMSDGNSDKKPMVPGLTWAADLGYIMACERRFVLTCDEFSESLSKCVPSL